MITHSHSVLSSWHKTLRRLPKNSTYCLWFTACIAAVSLFSLSTTPAMARHHRHHSLRHMVRVHQVPQSSMVIDAKTGRVLQASHENELRHPASITKVMTLYLLFEEMEKGRYNLNSELNVSMHAAAQSPSKLGLEPGDTIKVEDAIKAIVTRSANDVAVTIAENIGGTESHFAELMTQKAHSLGMSRTVYRNASGLPNDEQVTTAHDLTILGRAIQERFPKMYSYFQTHEFNYNGDTIRTHNHLLGRVEGVDGIKTGFTNASGFNLLTSVHRDNRFIIAVVMGGATARSRDNKMVALIDDTIDQASSGPMVASILGNKPSTDYAQRNAPIAPVATASAKPTVLAAAKPEDNSDDDGDDDLPNTMPPKKPVALSVAAPEPAAITTPASTPVSAPIASRPRVAVISSEPTKSPVVANNTAHTATTNGQMVSASAAPVSTAAAAAAPTPALPPSNAYAPTPIKPQTPSDAQMRVAGNNTLLHWVKGPDGHVNLKNEPLNNGSLTAKPVANQIAAHTNTSKSPETTASILPNNGEKSSADWMVQIGATDDADKAEVLLARAKSLNGTKLGDAQPFTEKVQKGETTLYRARFAGLDSNQAEDVCRSLKHAGFSCFPTKN